MYLCKISHVRSLAVAFNFIQNLAHEMVVGWQTGENLKLICIALFVLTVYCFSSVLLSDLFVG